MFNILPFYIIFLRIQIVLTIHFLHICKYSCTDWEPYASFCGLQSLPLKLLNFSSL